MAIVSMGTGNLLARNLGVPMGPDEALTVEAQPGGLLLMMPPDRA
jgi:diacylglycerol kinase family enzyme